MNTPTSLALLPVLRVILTSRTEALQNLPCVVSIQDAQLDHRLDVAICLSLSLLLLLIGSVQPLLESISLARVVFLEEAEDMVLLLLRLSLLDRSM